MHPLPSRDAGDKPLQESTAAAPPTVVGVPIDEAAVSRVAGSSALAGGLKAALLKLKQRESRATAGSMPDRTEPTDGRTRGRGAWQMIVAWMRGDTKTVEQLSTAGDTPTEVHAAIREQRHAPAPGPVVSARGYDKTKFSRLDPGPKPQMSPAALERIRAQRASRDVATMPPTDQ